MNKQYCRYCACAVEVEIDMIYCEKKNMVLLKAQASRLNKCKDFEFNEIDVFNCEHIYSPRKKKDYQQLKLWRDKI